MSKANERIWDLMTDLDYCMFATHRGKTLRARPMSTVVRKNEGDIVMLTSRKAAKDDEIAANGNVLLAYGDGSKKFVSLSGTARLKDDRELIEDVWTPSAKVFWPDGPGDPDIVAIVVKPTMGEYWEGGNALVSTVKFAVALATGSKPKLGENKKVKPKAA